MPASQAVKRKKTADMADSPPKRVTRARAKNTGTDDVASKPKATKITTASAKAAALKKNPAVPTKPLKRKTRADKEEDEATEEAVIDQEAKSEPTKAKGRAKEDITVEKENVQVQDAPKTRARPPKTPAAEVPELEAPKTRGRPKKTAETARAVPEAEEETEKPKQVKRITRGRPATNAVKISPIALATKSTAAAQKKRVKFEQEPNKENVPIETDGPKKPTVKQTGLKAKPVRKPAAARNATRGSKAAIPTGQESRQVAKKDVLPLSPKKVNQVAKSDPTVSEDELAGEKTPLGVFSQSPAKRVTSPVKDMGSVSKLRFDQVTAPLSPSKPTSSSILASPARRPPISPFKDALKTSPKRIQLGGSIAQPVLLSSRTPTKGSLLQVSPRRGNLGDGMTQPILLPTKSPSKLSLLQESPKRVRIEDKTTQPILVPSKSPFKASLLQSPARRPPTSPTKSKELGSPVKSGMKAQAFHAAITSRQSSTSNAPRFPPEKTVSSPFRAAGSPEKAVKVHTITDEERKENTDKDNSPVFCPRSPTMEFLAEAESPLRTPASTFEKPVSFDDTVIVGQSEHVTHNDDTLESSKPAETTTAFKGPAFSLASAALRRVSIESGSEDELASPDKGYAASPLRRHEEFGTPAVIDGQDSDMSEDQLSFTPLADQLNSWAASSPDKQNAMTRPRQARGMFSLGGASMLVAPEPTLSDVPMGSPAKSSFFEDEMVMRDGEEDIEDASFAELDRDNEHDIAALQVSQESQASDEYGDENAMPSDAEILRAEQDHTLTCTPAKVFTPAKKISQQPREIYTVSKVPLRASADDSPLIMGRQRSRSFGGPLSTVREPLQNSGKQSDIPDAENENVAPNQPATPVLAATNVPQTPGSAIRLDAETPGRTARKSSASDVLQGAVVFVDVHTSEGADASGIFVELLTQMGARCVKQWSWNPRASMGSSLNDNTSQAASPDTSKVGITHVVYKDGGKRTLEKVRSSNGVVLCVGVGWVLE